MKIFYHLCNEAKREHWLDALEWLGWSLILGLMPIWASMLTRALFRLPFSWANVTSQGEFALYSASFLGTCFYIVGRDFRNRAYPSRSVLNLILAAFLVVSICLYLIPSFILLVDGELKIELLRNFNGPLLVNSSLWLLPIVCALTYLIIVADNVGATIDLREVSQRNYNNLNKQFDLIKE